MKFIHSKPDAYDSDSAFYRWKAKVNLLGLSDENFGKALDIQVNQRSKSGYVTRLTIVYESGEMVLENENQIRNALGKGMTKLILANEEEREFSTIPSACFALEKKEDGNYILYGGGFGHGIGLSQYGANAQAKEGKNYRDILQFYYKDVEIRNQSMI